MELATLRRLHSASGLFPLGAYLLFHAWEHWPVRDGRDALFARLAHSSHVWLETLLVVVPLLLHAGVGLRLARTEDVERAYASRGYRRLQALTGLLAAAFVVSHLIGSWLPRLRDPNPIGAAYGATMEHAGSLPGLIWYATGLAAVCAHFGHGLGVALTRLVPGFAPGPARWLGGALGVSLWLAFLNELASYATYAPLL